MNYLHNGNQSVPHLDSSQSPKLPSMQQYGTRFKRRDGSQSQSLENLRQKHHALFARSSSIESTTNAGWLDPSTIYQTSSKPQGKMALMTSNLNQELRSTL